MKLAEAVIIWRSGVFTAVTLDTATWDLGIKKKKGNKSLQKENKRAN